MLTTEDRLAIGSLYARYCANFDLGSAEGWASCFAEEGVFVSAANVTGRTALKVHAEARFKTRAEAKNKNVQHWNANLIVEGDGTKANGLCYILLVGQGKEDALITFTVQGTYVDELVKTNGAWHFSRRHMHRDLPPPSLIPSPQ